MRITRATIVLNAVSLLCLATGATAETITWTGSASTNSWHTPSNWDLNRVPAAGDDVVIPDMTPNVIVTHSGGTTTVNSLTSAEAFTLIGSFLNINSASSLNSSFLLGGTLGGSGDVTVNGAMDWTGFGTMEGTGRTIISSVGSLVITDPNAKTLSRTLENHSANANWTGGSMQMNNGTFTNASEGTFTINVPTGVSFSGFGGTNAVNNAGILNKAGLGLLTANPLVSFNNTGTVNVDAGGLTINGGGTNSGTIDVDAGVTLSSSASYTHGPASSLVGQGTLTFTNGIHFISGQLSTDRVFNIGGGTVNFNADYTISGTINLTSEFGGSGIVTITGTLNWTGFGTMSGTGRTVIAPGATLTISDTNPKTLSRQLDNHSPNASWTNGNMQMNNGVFNNETDGTVTVNAPMDQSFSGFGGVNSVNNAGAFNKSGATTISTNALVQFNNTGTFNLNGGGLTISGGGSNAGTINAEAGTILNLATSMTHAPASSLLGLGTLTFGGGTHNISGTMHTNRTININAGSFVNLYAAYTFPSVLNLRGNLGGGGDVTITGTVNWTGFATMEGMGRTIVNPAGTLSISDSNPKTLSRRLENRSANTSWTDGNIQFNNGTLINESGGILTSPAGDHILLPFGGINAVSNSGVFNKAGAGTLTVFTGLPFTNNGTLNVQSGTLSLNGGLTNGVGASLTGGTYVVAGTLQYPSANIVTNAAAIILDGPTSSIQSTGGANALANFADNTANASFQIKNGRNFARSGSFSNAGQVTIGPGDDTLSIDTITNSGTLTKPGTGTGNVTAANSFTNSGTIDVQAGMLILSTLSNHSGTTVTGGTYNVAGTLRFPNASIGTNAANIILDGAGSAIQDLSGANALGNLVANTATGSLQIKNGRNLALPATFVNQGQVRIGPGASTLSDTGNYVQSSGTTTLDGGTLDPTDLAEIQAGELAGSGAIAGDVRNSGTCRPLDISVVGDYQQMVPGVLAEAIGGTAAGINYGRLAVSGTALLAGTLNITLTSFVPSVGNTFDLLTANLVEVKLATINSPVLPNLMGWQFEDVPGVLRLSVIDCGPGDADNDGVGDACDTVPDLSWHKIAGGGATSSGGNFKLSATIGQHDAGPVDGPMTGDIFTLVGGFWPGVELVDETTCSLLGDMNLDGLRNGIDIRQFVGCLLGGGAPECSCADVNESGAADAADVGPFVQLLLN